MSNHHDKMKPTFEEIVSGEELADLHNLDTTQETDPTDAVGYRDYQGDTMLLSYIESDCPHHGPEAGVVLAVNNGAVLLNLTAVSELAAWLNSKHQKAKSRGRS